jgi:hypothetical protein
MNHRGDGGIFRRGNTLWIVYWARGKCYRESARTADEQIARKLLRKRVAEVRHTGRAISATEGKDHANLVNDHLTLTEDHHQLRNTFNREVGRLLQRNQQQETLLKMADQMHRKLEGALGKVLTLLQRHLEAGDSHVPAKALWHVLHDAGFTASPKPTLDHALHVALKHAPELEQQTAAQKTQQNQLNGEQYEIPLATTKRPQLRWQDHHHNGHHRRIHAAGDRSCAGADEHP